MLRSRAIELNYIKQFGPFMVDNGYPIVPIIPGAKIPGRYMGGKWLPMPGWAGRWAKPPSDFEVRAWSAPEEGGVGIVSGLVCGVDIDVKDEGAAKAIQALSVKMLGDTPLVRVGQAPKRMLVYKTDKPFAGIKRHPLELLCKGQQFVAYAIHPNTGEPYVWTDESPASVDKDSLPEITEEQAIAFLDEAWKLVPENLKPGTLERQKFQDVHISSVDQKGTVEAVASALSFIPNNDLHYDDWVYVGLAIKGALGGEGGELFDDWSGRSKKYDGDVTLKTWDSLQPNRIGAGTVYTLAQRNGWVPPAHIILNAAQKAAASEPHPAQGFLDRIARGEIKPVRCDDDYEPDIEPESAPITPVAPVVPKEGNVTLFGGMTGAIALLHNWIMKTSRNPQPQLALGCVITAVGAAAGRRFASQTDLRTNIYTVGLADSGAGKDHARKCIKKLFMKAGLGRYLTGDKFASGQAVLSTMTKYPVRCWLPDEFGHVLAGLLAEGATEHKAEILSVMTELYSAANGIHSGTEYANQKEKETIPIWSPHLCAYGVTNPKTFWEAFTNKKALSDGSLARWLIFETDLNNPDVVHSARPTPPPPELIDMIKEIAIGPQPGTIVVHQSDAEFEPTVVSETPEASKAIESLFDYQTAEKRKVEGTPYSSIVARFAENAVKIALIAAISENPRDPIITTRHVEWAKLVTSVCLAKMIGSAEDNISDSETEARSKKLLKLIRDSGGMSNRDLQRKTGSMENRHRAEAIQYLVESELIRTEQTRKGHGKPTVTYYPIE